MKKTKISLLALAVLAGGITAASAASVKIENAATYTATVTFVPTNVPVVLIAPSSVPRSLVATGLVALSSAVSTDASGKIEGTTIQQFGDPASNGYVRYVTSITGNVRGKSGSAPVVNMSLRGNGYSALSTNINQVFDSIGTAASLNLRFQSSGVVLSNLLAGRFNGTVRTGVPVLQNLFNNGRVQNSPAVLDEFPIQLQSVQARVVQVGSRLFAESTFGGAAFTGSGNVNNNRRASVNFKGIGPAKGATVRLSGTSQSIPVVGSPTNNTVTLFSTTDVSGRAFGQTISRSTAIVTATP